MKIIIAAGIYPPDIGGPATYSQMIEREFSKRGIDTKVICYSDEKGDDVIRILRKHNILVRYFIYFWNLLKLAKDYDIIYAQGPLSAGLPAMLVNKILRKKFVIKVVGDYAWEQYQNKFSIFNFQFSKLDDIETFQKNKYDFLTELRRKIQKFVCKSADRVIVPSEFLKKIVRGWGVDEKKIEVIYNAVELFEVQSSKIEDKEDIIISAGRLMPWKGMDALVEIMPDLLAANPDFKLIIVGRGPLEQNLKSQISNLKLGDAVSLIDKLPHEELMKCFKASKIFVLNSGYEGLPHIVLEAMACGLPVIITNVCGNPEIIRDVYNGLLIEYNNKKQLKEAIFKLWKDKELQKKFIENGYKTLEKFKLEIMIDKTLKVLKI